MKSDKVNPTTTPEVSKAFCSNTSVGALTSIESAGSAASTPNKIVNARESGPIRNRF
jgi:hypothetical protein